MAVLATSVIDLIFLLVARLFRGSFSNRSRCFLLKVALPEWLRDKVPVDPGY
jgi:hypothetical protein